MNEDSLSESLELYNSQLKQVEQALQQADYENAELLELKANLVEIIALTTESLLSYKKASLLKEYVQEIDETEPEVEQTSTNELTEHNDGEVAESHSISDVIGTCVQAPFSHDWGGYQYHNAAIISLDTENQKVRVMYLQPTHSSMKICPFYLESRCRNSDDECDLSHGQIVDINELREYEAIDNSQLSVGDHCLAKFSDDDIWYKATVVDLDDANDVLKVMFNEYGEAVHDVTRSDVIPRFTHSDSDSSSSDSEQETTTPESTKNTPGNREEEDEMPNYLWKPNDGECLAEWEAHTKGVGSRLMSMMGYKPGQGLGKSGQGRVEPVPILKLPPGKSLDRIMELKERTGNKDMFNVLKKLGKEKLPPPKRKPKEADLFTYLNQSLGHGNKVDLASYRKVKGGDKTSGPSVITKQQLLKKSDRSINIQVFRTEEEISKVENEILSIKQRLEVNVARKDLGGINHLKTKLFKAEKYLATLRSSHRELHRHKGQRENRKKLEIF